MKKSVIAPIFLVLQLQYVIAYILPPQEVNYDCFGTYEDDYINEDGLEIVYLPPEKILNIIDFLNKISRTPGPEIPKITRRTTGETTTLTSRQTEETTTLTSRQTEETTTLTSPPTEETTTLTSRPTEETTTLTSRQTEETTTLTSPPTEETTTLTPRPTEETTTAETTTLTSTKSITTLKNEVKKVEDPVEDVVNEDPDENGVSPSNTVFDIPVEPTIGEEDIEEDDDFEGEYGEDSSGKKSAKREETTTTENENDSKPKDTIRWFGF